MQVCTSLQTDNHASTPPLSFLQADALPVAQPTVSKHWRCTHQYHNDKSKSNTISKYWWHAYKYLLQNCQQMQNFKICKDFSSTFKHLICFQALSRALKFLFQIQAFSRISQARYEPWIIIIIIIRIIVNQSHCVYNSQGEPTCTCPSCGMLWNQWGLKSRGLHNSD